MSCWAPETKATSSEASTGTPMAIDSGIAACTDKDTDANHLIVDCTSTTVPKKRRARGTRKSKTKEAGEEAKEPPILSNGNRSRRRPRRKPATQRPSGALLDTGLDPRFDRLARKQIRLVKRAARMAKELQAKRLVGDRDGKPGLLTMFNKTMQPSALFRSEDEMDDVVEASDECKNDFEDIPMDE